MLATFERLLSPSLTFPTARANVYFRSRPVAPQENPRRLQWVGSASSIYSPAALDRPLMPDVFGRDWPAVLDRSWPVKPAVTSIQSAYPGLTRSRTRIIAAK